MKTYTAVVERSPETGLFVGFIPGLPGAHTQAESLDELTANLREVLAMLFEDGEPQIEAEFIDSPTAVITSSTKATLLTATVPQS
jgi:predicted RNase H-like HicB family nuclease